MKNGSESPLIDYKLSILIHGKNEDREAINAMLLVLQEQLNQLMQSSNVNQIEAMFCVDSQKSPVKRLKSLLYKTSGTYYLELYKNFILPKDFLRVNWFFLEDNIDNEEELRTRGIRKRKPWQFASHYKPK